MAVRGINDPKRTFPTVVAACSSVGMTAGVYECAGNIDALYAALTQLQTVVSQLQGLAGRQAVEDLGVVVATGADQVLTHNLGGTPGAVLVLLVEPFKGDAYAIQDYVSKDPSSVTIKATKDSKVRVVVVR